MSEKAQHEEEMELAKETFKNALLAILTQCKHLTRHTIHYLWLYSHKPFLDTVYYSYLHIALKTSCSIQLYSDKPVVREDDRGQRPDRGKYSTVSWGKPLCVCLVLTTGEDQLIYLLYLPGRHYSTVSIQQALSNNVNVHYGVILKLYEIPSGKTIKQQHDWSMAYDCLNGTI